jgi:hypothetical protein
MKPCTELYGIVCRQSGVSKVQGEIDYRFGPQSTVEVFVKENLWEQTKVERHGGVCQTEAEDPTSNVRHPMKRRHAD